MTKLTDFTFAQLFTAKCMFEEKIKDLIRKRARLETIFLSNDEDVDETSVYNEIMKTYNDDLDIMTLWLAQIVIAMKEVSVQETINDN